MTALAMDSSDEILSVSLKRENEYFDFALDAGLRHSERLLELVQSVLAMARCGTDELSLVACMKGPGSFTGLRIGMATAKGIALSRGIPLYAQPTLDCAAAAHSGFPGIVLPFIDAKKRRWYTALYRGGAKTSEDLDATAEEIAAAVRGTDASAILATGVDAPRAAETLRALLPGIAISIDPRCRRSRSRELLDAAVERFERGDLGEADDVGLNYLRKSEAETTRENSAKGDTTG